ncbi:MAG: hypothetical protein JWR21_3693 [Herminiimonas sp.]|nr:hypothetical protein [Herminiimonas sp.]
MILNNLRHALSASAIYRKRFGPICGIRMWYQLRRRHKLAIGDKYPINVPMLVNPVWLRAGTSDLQVFQQVVCSGETDFELAGTPELIVDAGANVGLTSIVLAARYPKCSILALEVEDANYRLLCQNVANYPNVIPVKKALWGSDGFVKISNPAAGAWAFQVVDTSIDDPDAIPAISIDTLLAESGGTEISLLKIDIEGAEVEIFRSPALGWINKTKVIAVELHDRMRPGCTDSFNELLGTRRFMAHQQGEYQVVQFT